MMRLTGDKVASVTVASKSQIWTLKQFRIVGEVPNFMMTPLFSHRLAKALRSLDSPSDSYSVSPHVLMRLRGCGDRAISSFVSSLEEGNGN